MGWAVHLGRHTDEWVRCGASGHRGAGADQRLIRTVTRRGFRFVGEVREERNASSAPVGFRSPRADPSSFQQNVTFCQTSDGVHLAVAAVGSGMPLVKAANWLNHLEFDWQSPVWSPTLTRLAESYRVVRYDGRGLGLSDLDVADLSFEAYVRDLETVVDTLGLERFPLLGISGALRSRSPMPYAIQTASRTSCSSPDLLTGGSSVGVRQRSPARGTHHPDPPRLGTGQSGLPRTLHLAVRPRWTPEQHQWFRDRSA